MKIKSQSQSLNKHDFQWIPNPCGIRGTPVGIQVEWALQDAKKVGKAFQGLLGHWGPLGIEGNGSHKDLLLEL